MITPKKTKFTDKVREPFNNIALKLPLPKINPNIISISTIFTTLISVGFLANDYFGYFLLFLLITLLLDWLDGLVAKKYKINNKNGFIYDVVCDRISELILFSFIYQFGLILVFVNCLLTLNSFRSGKYWAMPLRQILLIIAIVRFIL